MSIDMSRFYQVYFEETAEHLASMEALLLELDLAEPDSEQLNAVFRAAQSIKGSSGTFGFTDMADVTQILENLLDRIRKGDGEVGPATMDATCARLRVRTGDVAVRKTVRAPAPARTGACEISFAIDGAPKSYKKTVDNRLSGLGRQGTARLTASPVAVGQPYRIALLGCPDVAQLRYAIEFVAGSDSIQFLPLGEPKPAGSADGAYGLFADEPEAAGAAEEAAHGFFEPLKPAATPARQIAQAKHVGQAEDEWEEF